MKEVHTINYYPINEGTARRAKEMNSFSDYKEGSATAEYRAMVDKAAAIAGQQKSRVDPMYHEKIDHLLDTYARKLAENMNQSFAIDARVPSVMIAGPANFPVGKKEKQNRARDSNMEEWRYIQGLLDKIRSTGMGGISADDPAAIEKLQKKLNGLERSQLIMKEVNAYYRKHGKLDGCALLSPDQIEKLKASMQEEVNQKTVALSIRTTKLTGKVLAAALGKVVRALQKHHQKALTPQGRQSVKKLMNHYGGKSAMPYVGAPKDFDRIAKEFHVDYAFHKVSPGHYLLFFKANQADAITAAFQKYSAKVLNKEQDKASILGQLRKFTEQIRTQAKEKQRTREAVKDGR